MAGEEDVGAIARHAEKPAENEHALRLLLRARARQGLFQQGSSMAALDVLGPGVLVATTLRFRAQAMLQKSPGSHWLGGSRRQLEAARKQPSRPS